MNEKTEHAVKPVIDAEDLMTEKAAAGIVAGAFFVGSVVAGAKIRIALLGILGPVALAVILPHAWRSGVRGVRKMNALRKSA